MACYDWALQYAQQRIQFGKPIATFQLVQQKLVRMITEITKAQLLCLQLGRLKDAGTMRPQQVSMAKMNNVAMALETARMARRYNHANVLALSLRATSPPMGREIVEAFLAEPDGADDFDVRNVAELRGMEEA